MREGWLLKHKAFADAEARVVGFVEKLKNVNAATRDARGHVKRSHARDGRVGAGTLGALVVHGLNGPFKGVRFQVGSGFTVAQARDLWDRQCVIVGRVCKYRYQPYGSVDAPRFPVFLGFRDARDL